MVGIILVLSACFQVSVLSLNSEDPSGWNTFYQTETHPLEDVVDVVDPLGWNYDRQRKSSISNGSEDKKKLMEKFCKGVLEEKDVNVDDKLKDKIEDAVKFKVKALLNQETNMNDNIAFAKRFINILLHAAELSEKEILKEDKITSVIEIRASREQLLTLIRFSSSEVNVSLRELDSVLTDIIHRKHIPTFDLSASIEKIFIFVSQKEVWLPFFLGFVLLCIFRLLVTSKTTSRFLTWLIILIFCVSYVIEYYRMYKEVEIRQRIILEKNPEIPSSCNLANRFWLHSLMDSMVSAVTFNQNDECEQYHKATLLDPLVEVSPVRVLSNILADFIVQPSGKIGTAIAAFTSAIFGGLPIHYGFLVWVTSSIAIFIFICLVILLLINGTFQVRGLLGGFSISSRESPQITNTPHVPETTSHSAKQSHPILETVHSMKNLVVMDVSSLGALMMRAQNTESSHSGVEELAHLTEEIPSKPSDSKLDLGNVQERSSKLIKENESHCHESCIAKHIPQDELNMLENKEEINIKTSTGETICSDVINSSATVHSTEETVVESQNVNEEETENTCNDLKNVAVSEID